MADNQHHSDSIDIVKRVICVNKIKPQIPLVKLAYNIDWTRCTAPSVPSLNEFQRWSFLHKLVASYIVTLSTNFAKIRHHVYPTPTGSTPGNLYNAIRWPDINAWEAAHGGFLCLDSPTNIWHWHKVFYCGSQNLVATPVRLPNLFHWALRSLKVFLQRTRPNPP